MDRWVIIWKVIYIWLVEYWFKMFAEFQVTWFFTVLSIVTDWAIPIDRCPEDFNITTRQNVIPMFRGIDWRRLIWWLRSDFGWFYTLIYYGYNSLTQGLRLANEIIRYFFVHVRQCVVCFVTEVTKMRARAAWSVGNVMSSMTSHSFTCFTASVEQIAQSNWAIHFSHFLKVKFPVQFKSTIWRWLIGFRLFKEQIDISSLSFEFTALSGFDE